MDGENGLGKGKGRPGRNGEKKEERGTREWEKGVGNGIEKDEEVGRT